MASPLLLLLWVGVAAAGLSERHLHGPLLVHGKRIRGPVRVHHIHLNVPPPHIAPRPAAPPRKFHLHPAPPAKTHFSPSPPAHFAAPIIDSTEGAIHTIPAPNLGPNGDRPIPPPAIVTSVAGPIPSYAINSVHGYEVHEPYEPAAAYPSKANFGKPFYAPDPDPSLPAPQVPVTTDPHSHPSNGKVPLDLIFQQRLETHRPAVSYGGGSDPNSQFLQAFQDQYKYPDELQLAASEVRPALVAAAAAAASAQKPQPGGRHHVHHELQLGAASEEEEEEEEELLEHSAQFGQRIKPIN